ncbi:YtxH domain-containing protein [Thermoproteota archaeon]
MRSNSNFFDGIIFGAIIGVLIGFLFAPTSGKETREKLRKIKEENDELIKETREKTETVIAKTMDAIENGFEKVGQIVDERRKSHPKMKETEIEA